MRDINITVLTGRLTRDAEVKLLTGERDCLSFSLAFNSSKKNPSTGAYEEAPNFIDCAMFGKGVDKLGLHLAKGTPVTVSGSLSWSSWERDGQKRSKHQLYVSELKIGARGAGAPGGDEAAAGAEAYEVYSEDIPF